MVYLLFLKILKAVEDCPSDREIITCNLDTEIAIFYHLTKIYIDDLKKKVNTEVSAIRNILYRSFDKQMN